MSNLVSNSELSASAVASDDVIGQFISARLPRLPRGQTNL